jgi:hypothetical protein
MTTAQVGYTPVHRWVKHVLGPTHTTVIATIAWAVLCLLVAQRVTPAALARALPGEHAGSGRSRLRPAGVQHRLVGAVRRKPRCHGAVAPRCRDGVAMTAADHWESSVVLLPVTPTAGPFAAGDPRVG